MIKFLDVIYKLWDNNNVLVEISKKIKKSLKKVLDMVLAIWYNTSVFE